MDLNAFWSTLLWFTGLSTASNVLDTFLAWNPCLVLFLKSESMKLAIMFSKSIHVDENGVTLKGSWKEQKGIKDPVKSYLCSVVYVLASAQHSRRAPIPAKQFPGTFSMLVKPSFFDQLPLQFRTFVFSDVNSLHSQPISVFQVSQSASRISDT